MKQKNNDNKINENELLLWQKETIDERLKDYYQNPKMVLDFDKTIKDIEKKLIL